MKHLQLIFIFSVVFLTSSCGSFECSQDDWYGTYMVSYEEHDGGTCGPIGETLLVIDDTVSYGNCVSVYNQTSEDQCTSKSVFDCEDSGNNITFTGSSIITQVAPNGDTITGVFTMSLRTLSTGKSICSSTYDIIYIRQ